MQDNKSYTSRLPAYFYSVAACRDLDQQIIEQLPIESFALMRRAASAAFDCMMERYAPQQLVVFCGKGNNAGDGYLLAAIAKRQGLSVSIRTVSPVNELAGDTALAHQEACELGLDICDFNATETFDDGALLVDAIFGTGLQGNVKANALAAIEYLNNAQQMVFALDVPSGLSANTGEVLGAAVLADTTISFVAVKRGLLTGGAANHVGDLFFASLLQEGETLNKSIEELASHYTATPSLHLDCLPLLARRQRGDHKGMFGHVMVVGGNLGMAGAPAMAAEAAARVGAGLVSCATRPEHVPAIVARRPEVMAHGVVSGQEIEPLLECPSVLVVGPGLSQNAWGEQLLQQAAKTNKPMVLDADALNILAKSRVINDNPRDNWVLTPHPGEAARLLNCTANEINQDRFAAITELQKRYGGVVVLKGHGSLVIDEQGHISLCPLGNPGMASGGMGDVLSGIIGGLIAQGLSLFEAARLAVAVHAWAGDAAAVGVQRGTLAMDLIPFIRQAVNKINY